MIDAELSNLIDNFNQRSADALGYNTPGYQPKFHDVLQSQSRTIRSFDPMSVAAPQGTYFVVDNGDGSQSYTRSGNFRVSEGKLVTADGRAVLGYPNGATSGELAQITVPAGVPDGSVRIAADGTVSYGAAGSNGAPGSSKADPEKAITPAAAAPAAAKGRHHHHGASASAAPVPQAAASAVTAPADPAVAANALPAAAAPDPLAGPGAPSIVALPNAGAPNVATLPTTIDAAPVALPASAAPSIDPKALAAAVPGNAGFPSIKSVPSGQAVADGTAPTQTSDSAMAASLKGGLTSNPPSTAIGTTIGRVAIARFAPGSVIDNQGQSSSGAPIEEGAPGTGRLSMLKTGARDIGNVDHLTATIKVSDASVLLNARLQAETAKNSNAKKAMDLLK